MGAKMRSPASVRNNSQHTGLRTNWSHPSNKANLAEHAVQGHCRVGHANHGHRGRQLQQEER